MQPDDPLDSPIPLSGQRPERQHHQRSFVYCILFEHPRTNIDGLSAAASVIAVVQISGQIFQQCQTYYSEVKDAENDIQRLHNEVMALQGIASSVNDLIATAESNKLPALEFLNQNHGLLQYYQSELDNLAVRLEKALGKDKVKRLGVRALKWPFDRKEIDDAVAVIERCKTTFNLALGCDQAYG